MSTTPNMGMTLPDVSVTPGPTYASQVNSAMGVVDGHDHTPGFGVKVPSAGLNINADLPFGGFNATGLLAAAFNSQTADPSGNARVYFKNGELYATDGSGNHVQMTSGGNVNVGSVGAITGMGGTSATVSYSNATKVFTFNQAANQTALLKMGDLQITDSTVGSGAAVTLKVGAGLATGYTLTAPTTTPAAFGATSILTVSSTGQMAFSDVTDETSLTQVAGVLSVKDGGVTHAKQAALGQQVSSASGIFTTNSGTFVDVTNITCTLTVSSANRPVMAMLIPAASGSLTSFTIPASANSINFQWVVDGTPVQSYSFSGVTGTQNSGQIGSLNTVLVGLGAGAHTVKLQMSSTGGLTLAFGSSKLVLFEL